MQTTAKKIESTNWPLKKPSYPTDEALRLIEQFGDDPVFLRKLRWVVKEEQDRYVLKDLIIVSSKIIRSFFTRIVK